MNGTKRFKLGAGAGLVTMLLGALMVLAPGAGAIDSSYFQLVNGVYQLPPEGGPVPLCHATSAETNPYILNSPNVSATGEFFGANHASHLGPVFAPGMKSSKPKVVWGDIIPPIAVDGVLVFGGSPNWVEGGADQYAACSAEPEEPTPPVIVVEKDVPGAAFDPTPFSFSLTGNPTPAGPTVISDGGSFESTVDPGTVGITEAASNSHSLTSVVCSRDYVDDGALVEDEAVTVNLTGTTATLTAAAGDIITCVFTNTPKTTGLTVVKKNDATGDGTFNTAEEVATAGLPVKFQVDLVNTGNQPLTITSLEDTWSGLATPIDVLAAADLACIRSGGGVLLSAALPAGSTTTCTFTLPVYSPAAGTSKVNEVTAKAGETTAKAQSTVSTRQAIVIIETPTTTTPPTTAPPEPASLRIVKVVDAVAGGVVPATWTVDFDVVGDDLDQGSTVDQDDADAIIRGIDAGTVTITETTPTGDTSTLTSVECVEADGGDVDVTEALSAKTATVVLDEGDDVTCTFTNTYPEVLSEGETPTTQPPAPTTVAPTKEEPKVLGVETTRLPRTGDETGSLAGLGALMLAVGAAMVIGSKRKLAAEQ